ncbi:MAG: glycosyl transferase family 2 [Paenibacillus sp.]|nr:glycosyl transferase family 2 [Paenibacillus sp.]
MLKWRAGKRKRVFRRKSRYGAARRKAAAAQRAAVARETAAKTPVVSVIIPVVNERRTIARVIRQAFGIHRDTEVIVVANGSTDGTGSVAEAMGAKVLYYPERLGHDVGRSIGAREAKGRILLFTDGDIVIPTHQFMALIKAVENGVDIALNSYLGPTDKMNVHGVILAKHALNIALSRPELKGASMTTIPHAISRKALETIGYENLAVPPKAQAIGICRGLDVRSVHYIEVGKANPIRRRNQGGEDPLEGLIIGDHLEAIEWYIGATNERGNKPDLSRAREIAR